MPDHLLQSKSTLHQSEMKPGNWGNSSTCYILPQGFWVVAPTTNSIFQSTGLRVSHTRAHTHAPSPPTHTNTRAHTQLQSTEQMHQDQRTDAHAHTVQNDAGRHQIRLNGRIPSSLAARGRRPSAASLGAQRGLCPGGNPLAVTISGEMARL